MKTRLNFVSNSSSSSSIVYGNVVEYDNIEELIKDESNNIVCALDAQGTSGECEDFVFRVTPERLKILRDNGIDISDGQFLNVMKEWHNDGEVVKIEEPLEGGRIFELTKDYSSPNTDKANDKHFLKWMHYRAWASIDED